MYLIRREIASYYKDLLGLVSLLRCGEKNSLAKVHVGPSVVVLVHVHVLVACARECLFRKQVFCTYMSACTCVYFHIFHISMCEVV